LLCDRLVVILYAGRHRLAPVFPPAKHQACPAHRARCEGLEWHATAGVPFSALFPGCDLRLLDQIV
jgi:hypothetical protein